MRPACEIDPVFSIASSKRIFPGPSRRSLRVRFKVMRRFANRQRVGKWQQRHSATGRYWQFFRRPLKFAFRFASITITVANSEGNLKEAAVIETSHVTKNPQRECITLDRTRLRAPRGRPYTAWRAPWPTGGTVAN